jgi:uncharacterized protein (DUF2141 family)
LEKLTNKLFFFRNLLAGFLLFFFSASSCFGQDADLSINVTAVEISYKGNLKVGVFNSAESFKNKAQPVFESTLKVKDTLESLNFKRIPPGFYAVAIYHDENEDNTLNTKKFGIPTEGVGFSGSYKSRIKPPDFKEAGFNFSRDTIINIEIRYPKKD